MRHRQPVTTLVDLLRLRAEEQPRQTAFTWLGTASDETITYATLDQRAQAIAALLQQLGRPGERALLLYPPGLDFVAALFGCLYAGWIAVPAYPPSLNQRLERIQAIARDASPLVALTTAPTLARIQPHLDQQTDLPEMRWLTTDATAMATVDPGSSATANLATPALCRMENLQGNTSTLRASAAQSEPHLPSPLGPSVSHDSHRDDSTLRASAPRREPHLPSPLGSSLSDDSRTDDSTLRASAPHPEPHLPSPVGPSVSDDSRTDDSTLRASAPHREPRLPSPLGSSVSDDSRTDDSTLRASAPHREPHLPSPAEPSRRETSTHCAWTPPALESDSLAVLQYTSGSTAAPRGVMLSHANLLHNTAQIQRRFEAGPDSRGVIWLPPYHDMGLVGGILEGIYAGFPVALMAPVAFLQKPRRWLEAITRTAATISGGPNFAYDLCVDRIPESDRAGLDLSTWQVAFNGSEPVRARTLERFERAFAPYGFEGSAFYPCYGLAEATLMVSGGAANTPPVILPLEDGRQVVGCGRSIDHQDIKIVDGEVWVAGPSVSVGYWNQPTLTESTFGARLPTGEGPYLRTGDLGFVRDDELFITGRLKATLIVGGRKIQAEDIEACLIADQTSATPNGVVALSLEIDGKERLCVIQEVKPQTDFQDFQAIANSIRVRVAEAHQLPVWSVVLTRRGSVPRTSSGKVRRADCRAALLTSQLEKLYEWRSATP